ncbi:hypothetical protein GCM10028796_17400 [Ramlibacter monticola]|uniref:Uncharacterized protein n=1 Tax=Ramlibacter monticola TaxID=1926872 RepID=A0A936YYP9_9BURK|nr:hypothetical protein [Ramlibacter monticola]MBL0390566.1 hypothetical protein [Ramlibacter monticola]
MVPINKSSLPAPAGFSLGLRARALSFTDVSKARDERVSPGRVARGFFFDGFAASHAAQSPFFVSR